jgi:TonB family protein
MRMRVPGGLGAVVAALCVAVWPARPAPAAQAGGEAALTGEWVSARPPAEVFAAARETLLALGFRLARDDARTGILTTRRRDHDAGWPDGPALGLAATQTPESATVHLRVAPGFQPSRLVVGAVVETATVFVPFKLPIARGRQTMYRQDGFADFVARRIADRLGERFEPLSADPEVRARQSPPTGTGAAACGAASRPALDSVDAMPGMLHEVKPEYPPTELRQLKGGTVRLSAEITEHGTVTGVQWIGGVEDRNLVAAATGAAGLWRFRAASQNGCAVRSRVVLELGFIIRR